ncbi:hemolysin III family protein [Ferrimonas sp. YFM]|uniref:PAQR family membrane homeostasis protein TrhA n=1 Tax=Ferrimonas sp. YFM TaxID=3028878 RepID=UPI0025747A6D|nr:hemolysin III family protein [Ferrimonas sp. YFM]BDY05291.1 channel protein hemolysin III family subfamily YqfA [Ferrimonas sp. YFM]
MSTQVHPYSTGEEIANAVTHGLGIAAAIVGLTLMLTKGIPVLSGWEIASISIYGASLILLFLFSTLYHAISHPGAKQVFKRLDHCAIYLLIAGTYTPMMVISLDDWKADLVLATIWAMALAGILFKAFFVHRYKKLALTTYLVMGWLCLLVIYPLYQAMPNAGFNLLWIGGLCYSGGVAFYVAKRTPYTHAIWHLCVLGGAVCHCVAIAVFVIPS